MEESSFKVNIYIRFWVMFGRGNLGFCLQEMNVSQCNVL